MRIENLDYMAALEFLAARCGVTLPEDSDAQQRGGVGRSRILKMNLCAARFFRETLFSDAGAPGREYYAKRKLSGATVKHFGLGYAPNSYDALKKHLYSNGFTDEEMVAGYLCQRSRKNENNTYDCFRNRVMFPIIDVAGNVIAFGGRVLDDSVPKYLNSSDTPAFKKSRNLFALNYARSHCKDGFILCEGYMDVIALHAAGFENAVATLGTAITPDQARIMKKYTDKVIISYDSDEAGQKAADKALRLLSEAGVEASVLSIPGAKDPDEYIKARGAAEFAKVLKNTRTGFEYKLAKTLSKYDTDNADGRARAARELCLDAAQLASRVDRDIYSQRIAAELSLDLQGVKSEIDGIIKRNRAKQKKEAHSEIVRATSGIGDRIDPDYAKEPASTKLERIVLGMMLSGSEFIKLDRDEGLLSPEMFFSALNRRIYEKIIQCADGFDIGMLSEDFTQDEVSRAVEMMQKRRKLTNSKEIFLENVEKLKMAAEKLGKKNNNEDIEDIVSLLERRRRENKK